MREGAGVLLLDAIDFLRDNLRGVVLRTQCVQYLETPAERAPYLITLKNGQLLPALGYNCFGYVDYPDLTRPQRRENVQSTR